MLMPRAATSAKSMHVLLVSGGALYRMSFMGVAHGRPVI